MTDEKDISSVNSLLNRVVERIIELEKQRIKEVENMESITASIAANTKAIRLTTEMMETNKVFVDTCMLAQYGSIKALAEIMQRPWWKFWS